MISFDRALRKLKEIDPGDITPGISSYGGNESSTNKKIYNRCSASISSNRNMNNTKNKDILVKKKDNNSSKVYVEDDNIIDLSMIDVEPPADRNKIASSKTIAKRNNSKVKKNRTTKTKKILKDDDEVTKEESKDSNDTHNDSIDVEIYSEYSDEMKKNRDRYIKYMDNVVEQIKEMKWGEVINIESLPYEKDTPLHMRKKFSVTKIIRYNTYLFNGHGSKNALRYFMNKTKTDPEHSYTKIVQLLNNKSFRRFIPLRCWEEFWEAYKDEPIRSRHLFELIRSDQPCKPYLDIEWEMKDGKDARKQDYTDFIEKLQNDLIDIFSTRYDIEIDTDNIMISSSHSASKVSFHIVINKIINGKTVTYRTNRKCHPESAWDLWVALIETDSMYDDVLDGAVYTTDREFRTIYSNKTSEFRPIVPYGKKNEKVKEDDIIKMKMTECLKYIVTYAKDDSYYHIKTPEVSQKYLVANRRYIDSETFIPHVYSDKKINRLMELIKPYHRTAEYTGLSNCGTGWRFTYTDRSEPCYTGNYHESNGFYVFENEKKGIIYMKCMSENCKGTQVLERRINTVPTKKLF